MIQSEKLLQQEMCTLTCSASGGTSVSLSCSATGQSGTNTLTVPKGSTISYTIPAYGSASSKSGSITMDSNKTLTATYSSSSSSTDVSWSRTALSSNGTMGGSSCAASASSQRVSGNEVGAWGAFSGETTKHWCSNGKAPQSVTYYTPDLVRVTSMSIATRAAGNYYVTAATISISSNNSNYTTIGSYSNNTNDKGVYHSVSLSNTSTYGHYIKINITASAGSSQSYIVIGDCTISGYKQTTTTTYYWNVSIS